MKKKKPLIDFYEVEQSFEYPVETPTSPVEAITPISDPIRYSASESDSYASISASFLPPGYTKHEYAVYLMEKNKNKAVRAGSVIVL